MISDHACVGKVGLGGINVVVQQNASAWLLYDGLVSASMTSHPLARFSRGVILHADPKYPPRNYLMDTTSPQQLLD